jgi:hypothetical protein
VTRAVKLQQQASAYRVAQRPVRLAPAPKLAQLDRQRAAARRWTTRDQVADEDDVASLVL